MMLVRVVAFLLLVPLILWLAACGHRAALVDPVREAQREGMSRADAAVDRGAEARAFDRALEPPPEARPVRIDDRLTGSGIRAEDPFDLPPP